MIRSALSQVIIELLPLVDSVAELRVEEGEWLGPFKQRYLGAELHA
jgi:hypothetical protein